MSADLRDVLLRLAEKWQREHESSLWYRHIMAYGNRQELLELVRLFHTIRKTGWSNAD